MKKIKNTILLLLFVLSSLLYAQLPQIKKDDNNTTLKLKNSEITALKKKIEKLEIELNDYKKVKPIASKAVVPTKNPAVGKKTMKGKKFIAGIVKPNELSAYYSSNPKSLEDVKFKLDINGFDILAINQIFENKFVISFTNDELKNTNSFLSVLHMLVSSSEIRVQNPSYFGAAYLKNAYKYGDFSKTLKALQSVLGEMHETEEKLKLSDLPDYHFMLGMPHFDDVIVLARGENLLNRLKDVNPSKAISYVLKLPNGSTLVGHKLSMKTYNYLKKIKADNNAQIFPYEVIIKNKKAVMMSPKYYLALSLPLLSMTDFLKIASAPEEIEKDIKIVYKKSNIHSTK
jgi:hypothetical protein